MNNPRRPFLKIVRGIAWAALTISALLLALHVMHPINDIGWIAGPLIVIPCAVLFGLSKNPISVWQLQISAAFSLLIPGIGFFLCCFLLYSSIRIIKEQYFYNGVRQPDAAWKIEPPKNQWSKKKLGLFWIMVGVSPLICWIFMPLLSALGCAGNEGTGVRCSNALGVNIDVIATLLFLYMAWGILVSIVFSIAAYAMGLVTIDAWEQVVEMGRVRMGKEGAPNNSLKADSGDGPSH